MRRKFLNLVAPAVAEPPRAERFKYMGQSVDRRKLVSRAVRTAFRNLASGIVLGRIDDLWQDEGFGPADQSHGISGERRSLYQGYLDAVDWTDQPQVARALRVFERTAMGFERQYTQPAFDLLERDGYKVAADGRISGGPVSALRETALSTLSDPAVIREHLNRISRAIGSEDPAQAIGSAKELIESTAKVILQEVSQAVDDSWDLPKLALEAQVALLVHPTTTAPGPDGGDAIKRILGGVTIVAAGVAELRNRGYGTGHGPSGPRTGLGARHAHLAVGAARVWCEFMLDTLGDPQAPWRRSNP